MSNQPEPKLAFLSLQSDENGSSLQVTKHLMLHERGPKIAEFLADIIVHEEGHLAAVSCYGGKLKIIQLEAGRYKRDFDVSYVVFTLLESNSLEDCTGSQKSTYSHLLFYLQTRRQGRNVSRFSI